MYGRAAITTDSSFFYLFLTVIVALCCFLADKGQSKTFMILNVEILSFVSGFRAYTVGRDTPNYVYLFLNPDTHSVQVETSFRVICKVLMAVFHHPTVLLLIFSTLTVGLVSFRIWEMRKYVSYFYAFMTFYCLYYFGTMNGLRQYLAVAIVFWGTRYIQRKEYGKYIICILIAMAFHTTAIIGLLSFISELFYWKRLSIKQKFFIVLSILLGLGGVVYAYVSGMIADTLDPYLHYFNNANFDLGLRMVAVTGIFIASLFLYRNHKAGNSEELSELLISTRVYYVLACLLGYFGYYAFVVGRLNWYYSLYYGVYFGIITQEENTFKRLLMKAPILFVLVYTAVDYIWFENGGSHHPYMFVWNM